MKQPLNMAIARLKNPIISGISKTSPWDKFHGVCSLNGVITSFDLSKANHADIQYLRDIEPYYADCLMLGDKAYLDSEYQLELFEVPSCLEWVKIID